MQQTPFGRLCLEHTAGRGVACVPDDSFRDQTGGFEEESGRERLRGTEGAAVTVESESEDILGPIRGQYWDLGGRSIRTELEPGCLEMVVVGEQE